MAYDSHDSFTCRAFQLFTKEVAHFGDFVEYGEGNIAAEEPCGGRCLFFDERGGDP